MNSSRKRVPKWNALLLSAFLLLFAGQASANFYVVIFYTFSPYDNVEPGETISIDVTASGGEYDPALMANLKFDVYLRDNQGNSIPLGDLDYDFTLYYPGSGTTFWWNSPGEIDFTIPCNLPEGQYHVDVDVTNFTGTATSSSLWAYDIIAGGASPIYTFGSTPFFTNVSGVNLDHPNPYFQEVNPACPTGCSGEVMVYPNGGHAPYTYLWSDNSTSNPRTNICNPNLALTITNAAGCQFDYSHTMDSYDLNGTNWLVYPSECSQGNCNGFIAHQAASYPYNRSYQWSTGDNSLVISSKCSGNYDVTVTVDNACDFTFSHYLPADYDVDATINVVDESCTHSGDGSVLASGNSGTAPYSYQWSNGETTALIDELHAATYSLTITDDNGCTYTDAIPVDNSNTQRFPTASSLSFSGDQGNDIVSDENGDVYVVGTFGQNSNLDGFTVSSGSGPQGLYVMKYGYCGQPEWVSVSNSVAATGVTGVSIARDGNDLYITGQFNGTAGNVNFISDVNMITVPSSSMFVAKLDRTDGSFDFVQTVYSSLVAPRPQSVNVSPNGDILVCGGSGTSQDQVFVMKCSPTTGSALAGWPKISTGGSVGDIANDVVENASGIYVTGTFFGTLNLSGQSSTTTANGDAFLCKMNTSGTSQWIKKAGATTGSSGEGNGVAFINGDVYVTGGYFGQLSGAFGSAINQSSLINNFYVAKLDDNSNCLWVTKMDENAYPGYLQMAKGLAIAPTGYGNVYLTGNYRGYGIFFPGYVPNNNGGTGTSEDVFVANINPSGGVDWGTVAYGPGNYLAGGVAGADNEAYSTGKVTQGIMTLPPSSGLNHTSASSGYYLFRNDAAYGNAFKTGATLSQVEESLEQESHFKLYPNPSSGPITLQLDDSILEASFMVFDPAGRMVHQGMLSPGENLPDMTDHSKGVYTIRVESESLTEVHSLILQ
ncbi:T9SS type A sorting domain-containing protein [bacterium SCSIO 12741]|nr:T9SS type A sorting domain-containing protein [bacterium SCSIO 12741]